MSVLLGVLLALAMSNAVAQTLSGSRDYEVLRIDGKKNPELIPEWSAWEVALTTLAKGPGLLPDVLVPHFSRAEAALLVQEAKAQVERELEYHERVKRLQRLAATETREQIQARNREITLDYRWQTLRGRDALLARLTVTAQTELRRFVEATKQGTTVTILRKDLPFFLQPQ